MINIIIAIALIIIIIMFDNNFFDFNIDEFSKYNKIDKGNKRTVWVYMKPNISRNTRDSESIGVIKLCVKSIKKHLGGNYNVIVFNKDMISDIVPEYMEFLDNSKSDYIFYNILKYSIIYKYGGVWLPCSTIVLDNFNIDDGPYLNGKLIFFSEKHPEHNKYFNQFDFSAVASIKETSQVKTLLEKLTDKSNSFNNSFVFNNRLEWTLGVDANIHYAPISNNSSINENVIKNEDLIKNHPVIKLNKYIKLIFLDIETLKYSSKYQYLLNMDHKTIMDSDILLKKLFEYSNQNY
tara:strand:- start:9904 stop:10782 length:879 start_codon:yes stop_codon:yes gene_type:complete